MWTPFPGLPVQAPVYRPAHSPDSPHCCLHPGSLPFSGSQTSQAYFCHKAFSLTIPLTQMCFSGPHRTALFHLGLEPFLFTQPKGSLNHTLLLYPVLPQLLSETEIPFFFLTYLLPLSLKRIQSMVVPLDTKYSVCRTWSENSHVLSKGLLNKRISDFNSYSHLRCKYSLFSQCVDMQWNRKIAEGHPVIWQRQSQDSNPDLSDFMVDLQSRLTEQSVKCMCGNGFGFQDIAYPNIRLKKKKGNLPCQIKIGWL